MTSLDPDKRALMASTCDATPHPPAYRRWKDHQHLNPSSLSHLIAGGLLRRLVTRVDDQSVTRKSYAQELTRQDTPISSPTVARAAAELIDHRLVKDGTDVMRGDRGRPETALELVPFVLGVSVSDAPERDTVFGYHSRPVDKSRAVVVHAVATGLNGQRAAAAESVTVDFHGADSEVNRNIALVRAIVNVLLKVKWDYWRYTGAHLAGVGIMIGGQVHEHRVVHHSPNISVDQSLDLPALIKDEVDARLLRTNNSEKDLLLLEALVGSPILVENDADAHARHRAWFAHGRDTPMSYVLVLIKLDGLGGSITNRGRAGALLPFEIGHTVADTSGDPLLTCRCGNNGCLEAVVTPHGMAKQLKLEQQAGPSARAMTNLFFQKIEAGDPEALKVFDRGAAALGYAIANIMSLSSPEAIYISAPEGFHVDRFKREVERCARAHAFPGVRRKSSIIFEPTTSHDDDAAAAVAQVIEHTVQKFEHADEQFTGAER